MSLIATFTGQDKETIQGTLSALAADSKVFSARIQSELSFMEDHELYVYIQSYETVFLLRDEHRADIPVLADEECYMGEPPLYLAQGRHWTSPVYLLLLMCHAYKEVMRKTGRDAGKVHGVVITNTNLVNREDMEEIWEWLGVTVIDKAGLHGEVMTDFSGPDKEREQLEHFFANSNLATWKLDPEYDRIADDYLYSSSPLDEDDNIDDCTLDGWDEDDDIDDCTLDGWDEDDEVDESLNNDSPDDAEDEKKDDTSEPISLEEALSKLLDEFIHQGEVQDGKEVENKQDGHNHRTHVPLPESLKEAFTFTPFEETCPENPEEKNDGCDGDDD